MRQDLNGDQHFLNLTLSSTTTTHQPSFPHAPPRPMAAPSRKRRADRRRNSTKPGKTEHITPPYPWATDRRATVHSLDYLRANGVDTITGKVMCRRCGRKSDVEYDLREKFADVARFVMQNRDDMRQRAPRVWMNPTLPDCKLCGQGNCAKPVSEKKKSINWVFLLLGQIIGCCKLSELKYFCKQNGNHRTGAKDRVLYSTYLELCRQLDPNGHY